MKRRLLFGAVLLIAASSASAAAVYEVPLPGGYLDVEYFAGSGANTSYFVIDFAGNGGDTYAFGYRYDGAPVAADAYAALDAAGALEVETVDFGFGLLISKLAYLGDEDEPDFGVDERFWGYLLGDYSGGNVNWDLAGSLVGISDRALSNGSFDGFTAFATVSPDFLLTAPRLPIAVPEPASAALMIVSLFSLLRMRRSR